MARRLVQHMSEAVHLRRAFCVIGAGAMTAVGLAGCGSAAAKPSAGKGVVHVKVVTSAQHSTIVLAPVFIGNKGPFTFAVDTGATSSVVFPSLAKKLHLQTTGSQRQAQGVGCQVSAKSVKVQHWRVGDVSLAAETAAAVKSPLSTTGLDGLLGSDELSRFGSVTIDYGAQLLRLGS